MIYDSIANLNLYGGVFRHIIEFLATNDVATMPFGKYDVADGIFVNIQDITTKPKGDTVCEVHKKYIDLQYVVTGSEKMLLGNFIESTPKIPYDTETDVAQHSAGMTTEFVVQGGWFCVFFPGEYHKPGLCISESESVRKALFKIDSKMYSEKLV